MSTLGLILIAMTIIHLTASAYVIFRWEVCPIVNWANRQSKMTRNLCVVGMMILAIISLWTAVLAGYSVPYVVNGDMWFTEIALYASIISSTLLFPMVIMSKFNKGLPFLLLTMAIAALGFFQL